MSNEIAIRDENGTAILAALESLGAAATQTSLYLPPDLPFEEYEALGFVLGRAHRAVTWMIADYINYGERAYGEKYTQALEATNLAPQTLMNYASVARRVPPERRREGVPFGVHAEVAALAPREQTRWLDKAAKEGWRRDELRSQLRPNILPAVKPIEDIARELVRGGKKWGEQGYMVGTVSFQELCAALDEPE